MSEESFAANKGTLMLAYVKIADSLKNYLSSTVPYEYVMELAR